MRKILVFNLVFIGLVFMGMISNSQVSTNSSTTTDPSTSAITKIDPVNFHDVALLITDAAQANWSPDSYSITYTDMPDGIDQCGGVMILKLGETTAKRLTDVGKDPIWSPDGKWIAYVVEERERELGAGPTTDSESVWVISSDGSGKPFKVAMGGFPSWMPDSETLVFHNFNTKKVCKAKAKPNAEVNECFELIFHLPRVSHDGKQLVSEVRKDQIMNLIIFDFEGNEIRSLENAAGICSWIPNSSNLIFGGWTQENAQGLHVVEDSFEESSRLLMPGSWNRASVSPDKRFLIYDTMTPDKLDIYLANFEDIMKTE